MEAQDRQGALGLGETRSQRAAGRTRRVQRRRHQGADTEDLEARVNMMASELLNIAAWTPRQLDLLETPSSGYTVTRTVRPYLGHKRDLQPWPHNSNRGPFPTFGLRTTR